MEIQILSKKLIAPSLPTPHHLRTLNLSPLDTIAPPVYMAAVIYYPAPDLQTLEDTRKSMEASLSEILTLFYPFAGRYDEKTQSIDCRDQGVEYVEARVSCAMAAIMYVKAEPELLNRLALQAAESATTPLMLIQVNVFDYGGVAVGIRFAHRIADATTVCMFANGWTKACREGIKTVTPPNFDLNYIFPIKKQAWLKSFSSRKKEPANIVTKRFAFNKSSISSLRAIGSDADTSRVMAVTAVLWRAFMRASGNLAKQGSLLSHIVNMRRRTHVMVPHNICGNFWRYANTCCWAKNVELEELMWLLSNFMEKSVAECGKPVGGDELVAESAEGMMELHEEKERDDGEFRIFTSWCRFPMYEADFGWGRPIWVSSVHLPVRITVMMDSYDGDGIEVWVGLEEKEMTTLEQDPEFLAFTS